MRFSKYCLGGWLTACLVATSACGDLNVGPLGPTTTTPERFSVTGTVLDDSCLEPDLTFQSCRPIAGVRVEVLDGPEKGKVAMTDSLGRFDLGLLTQAPSCVYCRQPPTRLGASKDSWATNFEDVIKGGGDFQIVTIRLGQAPHTLTGLLSLTGYPNAFVAAPGVRVEIIGGPDAGKTTLTNDKGYYRFDDLATQDPVTVEFSKEGFVTTRGRSFFNLATNQSVPTWQLQANPGLLP